MGRASTRQNKTPYQLAREELGLSRERAAELLETIPAERIERIESERSLPRPDEVLRMAQRYKKPSLCNAYCARVCPIGQEYVPEIKPKELPAIVLEMLATLNTLDRERGCLIDISADGSIDPDELADFLRIQRELEQIKRDGYAVDREERYIGLVSVSFALTEFAQPYAFTTIMPASRQRELFSNETLSYIRKCLQEAE